MSDATHTTLWLFGGIFAVLAFATLVAELLALRLRNTHSPLIDNLVARIRAWWVMVLALDYYFLIEKN